MISKLRPPPPSFPATSPTLHIPLEITSSLLQGRALNLSKWYRGNGRLSRAHSGVQAHIQGFRHKFRVEAPVQGFKHPFRGSVIHLGVQAFIPGFRHPFRGLVIYLGVQTQIQGLRRPFSGSGTRWGFRHYSGVQATVQRSRHPFRGSGARSAAQASVQGRRYRCALSQPRRSTALSPRAPGRSGGTGDARCGDAGLRGPGTTGRGAGRGAEGPARLIPGAPPHACPLAAVPRGGERSGER